MEKENQTIEELKDKKVELNKQFDVRRAAVQAKEGLNQLIELCTQLPSRLACESITIFVIPAYHGHRNIGSLLSLLPALKLGPHKETC